MKETQVLIIGGGPGGMLLSYILGKEGIENIVIERQSRAHVLNRVRGGGMEAGTVEFLRRLGLNERMDREGKVYDTLSIAYGENEMLKIDMKLLTGKSMLLYGQKLLTEDLYNASDREGGTVIHEVSDVKLYDLLTDKPRATYVKDGKHEEIKCLYIAGCDGAKGVCRQSIPTDKLHFFEKSCPIGWLGIVSETPPYSTFVYAATERGFALASKRGPKISRYFLQCDLHDKIEDWSDERFWKEFKNRFPKEISQNITTGPIKEKTIVPLKSVVIEPMQYGRLFLAGDAAHTVPPTGAKGLNLAISDIYYLSRALVENSRGNSDFLNSYSQTALKRVWGAVRFSWWMTYLLHTLPNETSFEKKIKKSHFQYLSSYESAQKSLLEQYIGLPY